MEQIRGLSRAARRAAVLLADLLIFAALLLGYAYFHHVRIEPIQPVALATPAPRTPAPAQTPAQTPAQQPGASDAAGTAAETPTPTIDPDDLLQGRFADKFTDGEIVREGDSYRSGNVSVTVSRVQEGDWTYFVADIYVRYLSSFRTAVALEHSDKWMPVVDMARLNDAVVAISGDYFGSKTGVVAVRNGREWVRKSGIENDILVMYYDGTMESYAKRTYDFDSIYARGVYQIWCFGPRLLIDGQPPERISSSISGRNPRSAVGYFEPGHYCFVLVDGRQKNYSLGMTLDELAKVFYDLGCKEAYNLDGGDTVAMAYMGELHNRPEEKTPRNISDILYIAEPLPAGEGATP